jgi:hypothetical protein
MKWKHVLAAVAEMARKQADDSTHTASAVALQKLAERVETLYTKRTSRAALAELLAAFDAGVERALARDMRRQRYQRQGE